MEYVMLQKKLGMEMARALGDDMAHFFILGSSANSTVFPGVSDVNFTLILKDPNDLSESPAAVTQKALDIFKEYKDNPMFTTLVDFEIYFESQLPANGELNGFHPIKALALKSALIYSTTAKKFVDEGNPFADLEINAADLKNGASSLVRECYNRLSAVLSEPDYAIEEEETFDDSINETEFISIETVLLAGQAYLMLKKGEYVSKVDVPYIAEEEPEDGFDHELLTIMSTKRQGADYAGGYSEEEDFDSDDIADSGKESGVIHQLDNIGELSLNFIATTAGLVSSFK